MANIPRELKNKVSIIIPCKEIDGQSWYCIKNCEYLPNNKEIIVVDDKACPGFPATKRNWAMERATGNILAFIDSDAYPQEDWLDKALIHLQYHAAVCGPGILPPDSSLWEKAADLVYRWLPYSYRVAPKSPRVVAEFPSFNLIVWKDKAPKFKPYLTGEDSLFCREINGSIFYSPDIIVYHQRRPLFKPFWKQVATYGKHRGHLIRLALLGWISGIIVYGFNFVRGFFRRKI
jgi:glycosyltransferase involved in cell wall biosynthesis